MASSRNKRLTLLLALLLGLMPFTRVMADMWGMTQTDPAALHAVHSMQQHMMSSDNDKNPCNGCTTAHGCNSSGCACYQCGSCGATVLHEMADIHFASLSAQLPAINSDQLTHHPFLLFRPPRA
jgi:hypothetical protein